MAFKQKKGDNILVERTIMLVKEIEIKSFEEFNIYTNEFQKDDKIRLYRGQKEDWPLKSNLYRKLEERNQIEQIYAVERKMFEEFKTTYLNYKKVDRELSDWQILALAQHYKLPTRLLDWSANSLKALWFSFEEKESNNENRIVYGLVVNKWYLVDDNTKESPFNTRFIRIFQPKAFDERIISQESWFTMQNTRLSSNRNPDGMPRFGDDAIINEDEKFTPYMIKIKLNNSLRNSILTKLEELNINKSSIYPNLEMLCQGIEEKYLENI